MSLYSNFKKQVHSHSLILPRERLLLGISGGLDSTVLLDLLGRLKKEYRFHLVLAHVNYHLRGKDSNLDQALVAKLAASFNLPLEIFSVKLKSKSAIQNRARQIRFHFFEKISKKHRCKKIVLAHHAHDQVETFFMRLLRGAGLQGLAAMEKERIFGLGSKLKVVRPLLEFSKKELAIYAKKEKLKWREDPSNQKTNYLRNFVRLKIIKNLEKIHPQVIQKISEGIDVLQRENQWMEDYVQELLRKKMLRPSQALRIPLDFLKKLEKPLRDRVYLSFFSQAGLDLSPTKTHLNSLDEMVMVHKTRMKLSFSKGFGAMLEKGDLVFLKWRRQKLDQRGFFC